MRIIKSVRIKYFRSILNTTRGNVTHLETTDLNIIVGGNDSGKSNCLRALNLFFNNETQSYSDFDFWRDFSNQRHGKQGEKNRIEIELIIQPPKKQHFKNHGNVRWTKIWREESLLPDESFIYESGKEFSSDNRSSYYKWLKKIRFRYIPAIKGDDYFSDLMYELYEVLERDTRELEFQFNAQVREKTKQISQQLDNRLKLNSILQFRGSFQELFHSLEFGSEDGKLMLDQRGDGVKVRHIPIILQNMVEAELKHRDKRDPYPSTIWGFEEPENNLEFESSHKLSDQLLEYIDRIGYEANYYADEGIQIFVTTHSPIFYTLSKLENDKTTTFLVKKQADDSSLIREVGRTNRHIIEEEMKLKPLIELSDHWTKVKIELAEERKRREASENQLNEIQGTEKCIFLAEDEKDGQLKTLLESNGFSMAETKVISYNGCSKIESVIVLNQYIRQTLVNTESKIVVHLDKDYLTPEEIEKKKLLYEKLGIALFVTKGTMIESYFCCPYFLELCCPTVSFDAINSIVTECKQETRTFSIGFLQKKIYGDRFADKPNHLKNVVPEYYDENEDVLFHGKKVLGLIKSKLQQAQGENVNLDYPSIGLVDPTLAQIASGIWEAEKVKKAT